jgi:hypothetical protein
VRRWAVELFRAHGPDWDPTDALALTTFLHVADEPERLARAEAQCQPRMLLFLDEPAWELADVEARGNVHTIPDPHEVGLRYEGWWGVDGDGRVVGKSPQHPSMHRLYGADDMTGFLRAAPKAGRHELDP